MDPIPLSVSYPEAPGPVGPSGPRVFLDNLQGVELPEEGEIRFRYSRMNKTEREPRHGEETVSYELCLKAITDICDCEGKEDDGMSEPKDADEALDKLAEGLTEEDMEDESEDDNPDKY